MKFLDILMPLYTISCMLVEVQKWCVSPVNTCIACLNCCPTDLLSATDLNSPKKLKLVMQELRKVAAQYHAVGIQLSIAPGTIREFEVEAGGHDVKQYLHEVIVHWLGSCDPSPDTLVKSLNTL